MTVKKKTETEEWIGFGSWNKRKKQGVILNCIMRSFVALSRGLGRNSWRNPVIRFGIGPTRQGSMRHYFVAMKGRFGMKKVTRIETDVETNVTGRNLLWQCQ